LEVDESAVEAVGAQAHETLTARNDDGDRVVDNRIQPQVIRARARLVELRPHDGVLKLKWIAGIVL
jgi:hypothetical protein